MRVDARQALLCWFAADKRAYPWRIEAAGKRDPYRVWLSEVMLQQTTIAHARPYFERFMARWPDVASLAAAADGDVMSAWAGLGYYARARNLLACARIVAADHGGRFPDSERELRKLPGIGAYTAAAIAAIAYGRHAVAIDANVERIMARLFAISEPLPAARKRIGAKAASLFPQAATGDFVEALMELGQRVCTPRSPDCPACPISAWCGAAAAGRPEAFPVRPVKQARPRREGTAYWLEHEGKVLLVRRPPRGLLGGMLALPTDGDGAPCADAWSEAGSVDHVFTHFSLRMNLLCAEARDRPDGIWWPVDRLGEAGLPTLFAKLAARGAEWRCAA